jgi:hypothetical protein
MVLRFNPGRSSARHACALGLLALLSWGRGAAAQDVRWLPVTGVAQPSATPSAQSPTAQAVAAPVQVQLLVTQPAPQVLQLRAIQPGPVSHLLGNIGERMSRLKQPRYKAVVQPPASYVVQVPLQAAAVATPSPQASTAAPPPPVVPRK